MKGCFAVGAFICVLAHGEAISVKRVGARFGPQNCVAVTRSPQGTCLISTDCKGIDTSQTEFAFDCVGKTIVRHSFGFGGFDDEEDFDTGLKCDQCLAASPMDVMPEAKRTVTPTQAKPKVTPTQAKPTVTPPKLAKLAESTAPKAHEIKSTNARSHAGHVSREAEGKTTNAITKGKISFKIWGASSKHEKEQRVQSSGPAMVRYGPNGCVSVHKSNENHCIMSTNCEGSDTSNYEYGIVCVDKAGSPVKHLFGKDCFDPVETFDTLIACNECLGLEDLPDSTVLVGEVSSLSKEIAGLSAAMRNISRDVQLLNDQVFKPAPTPVAQNHEAEAKAPQPENHEAEAEAPQTENHEADAEAGADSPTHKHHLASTIQRHSKKHHKATHHRHAKKQHLRHSHSGHHRHHRSDEWKTVDLA